MLVLNKKIKMTDITPANMPNRYNTPCTVEIYHHNEPPRYFAFSDLQMAYNWIKDKIENDPDSHIHMFEDFCSKMEYEYHKNGLHGYVIAGSVPAVQYCVFYGQLHI